MGDPAENQSKTEVSNKQGAKVGLGFIAAGVVVFILCSLVQGAFGSSMFSSSYRDPGIVGALLINVTYWPGWIASLGLAGFGAFALWATFSKS